MSEAPGYLSFSQFDTFVSCGRKYQLRYLEKVPQRDKGYFIGGHAVHRTIEECESAGWWSDVDRFQTGGEALEFFHAELESEISKAHGDVDWGGRKSKAFPDGEDLRWWHAQGPTMLRRYSSLRREDHKHGYPLPQVEAKISFTGPGTKPVIGYIDQLFVPKAHEIGTTPGIVRDFKTGSRFTPDHPIQLAVYGHAVQTTMDIEVHTGQYVYLRAQDGRLVYEVDLRPWYKLLPELLAEWDEQMTAGNFIHRPGWMCRTCDVAAYCEVGKLVAPPETTED